MAVTNTQPNSFPVRLYGAVHKFAAASGHTFKVALMKTTYTFSASTDNLMANVASSIIGASGGYAAATVTITGVAANSSGSTIVAANPVSWTNNTAGSSAVNFVAAGAAVVYNDTASGANADAIVTCIDFGADYTVTPGTTFQLTFTSGLLKGTPV